MRMRQITLQRLQVFAAIYEHRSISAAARALGIAQPTASRHLRDLEAAIQLSLFVLDRGRLAPTAEADALYADSRFLGEGVARLEGRIEALRRGSGSRLAVISVGLLMHDHVPDALGSVVRALPNVRLTVDVGTAEQQLRMIAAGQVDLGIAVGRMPGSDARLRTIGTGRLVALVPKGHELTAGPVDLAALVEANLIGLTPRGPLGRVLNDALLEKGLSRTDAVTVNALAAVAPLASSLGRPAVVDEFTAEATSLPGLAIVQLTEPVPFDIHAVMSAKSRSGTASAIFVDAMTRRLSDGRSDWQSTDYGLADHKR